MKTSVTLLFLVLLLACTGCGIAQMLPEDPIYGIVSLRPLPVGHVIEESDVSAPKVIGWSTRDLLHPFRPRPTTGEFTIDASRIVGHAVKTFIPENRVISPQRDLR